MDNNGYVREPSGQISVSPHLIACLIKRPSFTKMQTYTNIILEYIFITCISNDSNKIISYLNNLFLSIC